MDPKKLAGIIISAILFFFAIIFALAASVAATLTRMATAAMMFVVAIGILYYVSRQPKTIVQRLEVSGEMKAVALKCPNCSASLSANNTKIISGVPYVTCRYCGHTFEVTEEPKW